MAIFLRRSFGVDITTSDFDDKEVEENIAYNCRVNELAVLPHIRRKFFLRIMVVFVYVHLNKWSAVMPKDGPFLI